MGEAEGLDPGFECVTMSQARVGPGCWTGWAQAGTTGAQGLGGVGETLRGLRLGEEAGVEGPPFHSLTYAGHIPQSDLGWPCSQCPLPSLCLDEDHRSQRSSHPLYKPFLIILIYSFTYIDSQIKLGSLF